MNTTGERLIDDYLVRLDAALADLPSERRREIVEEITGHISEAVGELPSGDEAALRELLERLGEPAEIAADARERFDVPPRARDWLETLAVVLLLVGGFLGGVGWLIGVVLLWLSTIWTTRDKLIGTLIVPGGLALPVLLALVGMTTTSAGPVCTSTGTINSTTHAVGSHTTCTDVSGTPLYRQLLLVALMVVLFVAPIASAVYLARRSRRLALA
jgi:hypothetical protein